MNRILGLCLSAGLLAGCAEQVESAKEQTPKIEEKIERAGESIEAASLTPKIKAAIIGNPMLNDPKNEVNVDSVPGHIHITGYVKSAADKEEATKLARQVLKENGATDMLHNDLVVRKGD